MVETESDVWRERINIEYLGNANNTATVALLFVASFFLSTHSSGVCVGVMIYTSSCVKKNLLR